MRKRALEAELRSTMRGYLDGQGEQALHRAYELGRRALDEGLGILDMAELQQRALLDVLASDTPQEVKRRMKDAGSLLVESLSPFEMTHRLVREVNTALRNINERGEEQARRIAHRLHDEVGQYIAAVGLALHEAMSGLDEAAARRFQKVWKLLEDVQEQIRGLSHEMRPVMLDDLGLAPAIDMLARGLAGRTGLEVTVDCPDFERLPRRTETAIYRSVQEALTNAARHANPSRIEVSLKLERDRVIGRVEDDGIGFDPEDLRRGGHAGLGLIGIRERLEPLKGSLEIRSEPGEGTAIHFTLPIHT